MDFEAFRAGYHTMSFAQLVAWYAHVAVEFPDQSYWHTPSVMEFLHDTRPGTLVELGGWDGGLAASVLPHSDLPHAWANCDLVRVEPHLCDDPRYTWRMLTDWWWQTPVAADAFVASHVIEHLSADHFTSLVSALTRVGYRAAYVSAPLKELDATDWTGSTTTHVLGWSMSDVDGLFTDRGWRRVGTNHHQVHGVDTIARWYIR